MNRRETPLAKPPARAPYFEVLVLGETITMRSLSLHAASKFVRDHVTSDLQIKLFVLIGQQRREDGERADAAMTALTLLRSAPELCELFAAVIGLSWADPVFALETVPGSGAAFDLQAFGSGVFEELHEAGWRLAHIAAAAVRIVEVLIEQNSIDHQIMERASFFLAPTANTSANVSPSSVTTSDPTLADD